MLSNFRLGSPLAFIFVSIHFLLNFNVKYAIVSRLSWGASAAHATSVNSGF